MAIIAMRAATSATDAIKAEDIHIEVQQTGHLVALALLGNGVTRMEDAVRRKVPFVIDATNTDDGTALMPWTHQLHDEPMVKEAKEILRRAHEGSGATETLSESESEIELDFKAQRVVSHVKEHIVHHGLHVYTQKWLFDSGRTLDERFELLRAMTHPTFGPHSASAAIANGHMPPLPAYSVPEFVRMLDTSWTGVTFQVTNRNIRDWIALSRPHLVEFPAPNIEAGKTSRTDRISKTTARESIELGLGFFLVELDKSFDQFRVVTPMLFNGRTKLEPEAAPYTKNYILKSYSRHHVKAYKQLTDLLRSPGRTKVARLQVCTKCGAIFSEDRSDLAHTTCTS
jgi:hypothetical protein